MISFFVMIRSQFFGVVSGDKQGHRHSGDYVYCLFPAEAQTLEQRPWHSLNPRWWFQYSECFLVWEYMTPSRQIAGNKATNVHSRVTAAEWIN